MTKGGALLDTDIEALAARVTALEKRPPDVFPPPVDTVPDGDDTTPPEPEPDPVDPGAQDDQPITSALFDPVSSLPTFDIDIGQSMDKGRFVLKDAPDRYLSSPVFDRGIVVNIPVHPEGKIWPFGLGGYWKRRLKTDYYRYVIRGIPDGDEIPKVARTTVQNQSPMFFAIDCQNIWWFNEKSGSDKASLIGRGVDYYYLRRNKYTNHQANQGNGLYWNVGYLHKRTFYNPDLDDYIAFDWYDHKTEIHSVDDAWIECGPYPGHGAYGSHLWFMTFIRPRITRQRAESHGLKLYGTEIDIRDGVVVYEDDDLYYGELSALDITAWSNCRISNMTFTRNRESENKNTRVRSGDISFRNRDKLLSSNPKPGVAEALGESDPDGKFNAVVSDCKHINNTSYENDWLVSTEGAKPNSVKSRPANWLKDDQDYQDLAVLNPTVSGPWSGNLIERR